MTATAGPTTTAITLGVREVERSARGESAPPFSLGHNVATAEEVTAWYDRVLAAGASAVTPPTTRDWGGTSACVADSDGFRWDFVHNPTFSVNADGRISAV
ncbi:MAG: VOC family protein [Gordonia sp. (in: high G+C Gram-positive bacteria)]|uniref:VOC family protein n=1 Tax=Gordonia sp. (in: high G+C Gram-positive bacteria) TaxID=84139 RepID=UPI0039E219AF